jgi:hypothetical protein
MARKLITAGLVALSLMAGITAASAAAEVTIPVNWPDGKTTILVTHDRFWPGWIQGIFNDYQLDYSYNGTVEDLSDHKRFVAVAEAACTKFTKTSQPGVVMDILGNIFVFGAAGAAYGPAVAAIDVAYKGVVSHNSAAVGTSDALGGAASAILGQGKRVITFEECGNNLFDKDRPDLGIHPVTAVLY